MKEKKTRTYTLRLLEESCDRLDELSEKYMVSKQNLLDIMILNFNDQDANMQRLMAERKFAKYKTPVRRQVDKLSQLINNEELGDAEREELRRLLGEA